MGEPDHVDLILEQWGQERPDLDARPMAAVGRLLRVARHLERGVERRLAAFHLNLSEFNVLAALRRVGEPYRLSPAELSHSLLLSSGGMTKRLDRLEREGLVERSPDPDDRRGSLVSLTAEGLRLVDEVVVAHLHNAERLLAGLTDREQEELASLLRKMLLSLEDGFGPIRSRAYASQRRQALTHE